MRVSRYFLLSLGAMATPLLWTPVVSHLATPTAASGVSAQSSCPNNSGYGGQVGTLANSAPTQAGHGCVLIIFNGDTVVFSYTGSVRQWTVPSAVTQVELHVIGAGGGGSFQGQGGSSGGTGGGGGYATGTLSVTPGDVYDIIVGQGGRHHCWADNVHERTLEQRRNFSFGGGAAGFGLATWDCSWASGGGRSAVRSTGGTDDIITAGGGGGGAYAGNGGAGGGLSGQSGDGGSQGGGGAQSPTSNAGGWSEPGYSGIQYSGGPAGLDTNNPSEGGGGGGGYYGGGGGGNNSGGGGGSSFIGSSLGLQAGVTNAGNGRTPGAVPPSNTAIPTVSGTICVGSQLTATTGSWNGATSTSFQWQSSIDGNTWNDITDETASSHVIRNSGFIRVMERAQNLFGSTTSPSLSSTAIDDTTLSDLTISAGTLDPVFRSDVFAYTVTVPHSQSEIRITPTRSGSLSTITVNGDDVTSGELSPSISLNVGTNIINVLTTNDDCSTATTLAVVREALVAPPETETTPTTTPTTSIAVVSTTETTTPLSKQSLDVPRRTKGVTLPHSGTQTSDQLLFAISILTAGSVLLLSRRLNANADQHSRKLSGRTD